MISCGRGVNLFYPVLNIQNIAIHNILRSHHIGKDRKGSQYWAKDQGASTVTPND